MIIDTIVNKLNAFHSEKKLKANVLTVFHRSIDCAEHVSFCVEMRMTIWDAPALVITVSLFSRWTWRDIATQSVFGKNEAWFSLQNVVLLLYECYRKNEVCLKYD